MTSQVKSQGPHHFSGDKAASTAREKAQGLRDGNLDIDIWVINFQSAWGLSKQIATHPQAILLANYERNPFIACWYRLLGVCSSSVCWNNLRDWLLVDTLQGNDHISHLGRETERIIFLRFLEETRVMLKIKSEESAETLDSKSRRSLCRL